MHAKLIVKNVGVLLVSEVLTNILSFILIFAIARQLGDVGLGKYSFAISFATIFIIFSELGTLTFLIKETSAGNPKTQSYIENIASMKLVLGIITFVLSILSVWVMGGNRESIYLVTLASAAMFFNYYSYLFRAIFQAYQVMEYDALTKLIEKLISVGLGIIVIILGFGIEFLLGIQIISFLVVLIISWIIVTKKIGRINFKFDFIIWKEILISSLPFCIITACVYIYYKSDTVMLTFLRGYSEVGLYNAGYKIIESASFIQTIVITAVFPAFSKLFSLKKNKHLDLLFEKSFYYLFCLGVAMTIGGLILSKRIIFFIYGPAFEPAVPAFQVMLVTLLIMLITYLMGYFFNAINRSYVFAFVVFTALFFNISINFFAIKAFGYMGASFVRLFTELLAFILFAYFMWRIGKLIPFQLVLRPILAVCVMAACIYFAYFLNLLILIPLAAISYAISLFLFGGFDKTELEILKELVMKWTK